MYNPCSYHLKHPHTFKNTYLILYITLPLITSFFNQLDDSKSCSHLNVPGYHYPSWRRVEIFRQSFLWSSVPGPYAGVCLHPWLKSIVLQSHNREQNPFPSFLCHACDTEVLCLYQHSCHQMLLGPVSTSTMLNFSLHRPDLKKKKKSELWSKCMQLLGMKLCFSATGVCIQLLPGAVLG